MNLVQKIDDKFGDSLEFYANYLEGFESLDDANDRYQKVLKSLKKGKSEACRRAYKELSKCVLPQDAHIHIRNYIKSAASPCDSQADPVCARFHRLLKVKQTIEVLSEVGDTNLRSVTLIPAYYHFPKGKLHHFNMEIANRKLRQAILNASKQKNKALRDSLFMLGWDFCLTEVGQYMFWQPHLHGLVAGCSRNMLRNAFYDVFPICEENYVKRPIRQSRKNISSSDFEAIASLATYSCKSSFKIRSIYQKNGKTRTNNRRDHCITLV